MLPIERQNIDLPIFIDGAISRISVNSEGIEANRSSFSPSISADGRYIAFSSDANNLVADDTNNASDIFVYDQQTGVISRVSVDSDGIQANGFSSSPSISADGRYVAFISSARLVADDTNGYGDIFVHDRETGVTSRVSVSSDGIQGRAGAYNPVISADGRYVAFVSPAGNLVANDTNGYDDIFVHDRETGITSRVSVNSSGIQASGYSFNPAISADGRYVAFSTNASNLVANDTNGIGDIFVHDRETGVTSRVSVSSDGIQGNGTSLDSSLSKLSISADGRYVAFTSNANNLVENDTNSSADIFVHDRETGITTRVSVSSSGIPANNSSYEPTISADGRYVTFRSSASNLVANDTNNSRDIFVHDRETGITSRVPIPDGIQGNSSSPKPVISASGHYVAFDSDASNLVLNDTNNSRDIFVYNYAPNAIDGTPSDDTLIGTKAYDRITGFGGADTLTGGAGGDEFVYTNIQDAGDTITDFAVGSDKIILAQLFQSLNLRSLDYTTATVQGYLRFTTFDNDTTVLIDPDGEKNPVSPIPLVTILGVSAETLNHPNNFVISLPGATLPTFNRTSRVSVGSKGYEVYGDSSSPSISASGRYVAFSSGVNNLVVNDTNNTSDIFVYDRQTGITSRVSVSSEGSQANNYSYGSISDSGRYVVFGSNASNLVTNDTNSTGDIFVHDRETGITSRVSVSSEGIQANSESTLSSISADGRYVAFASSASNLVANDTNSARDIFVHDRETGITNRVSVSSERIQANSSSSPSFSFLALSISASGRYVTFTSDATNLVVDDTNNNVDIFVHDRETGITSRVSVSSEGIQGNSGSYQPSISADGRYVAFQSSARNLVVDDTNRNNDIFVHDRETGITSRVSVNSEGVQPNGSSESPSISASGRYVAFSSNASDLVPDDTNNVSDIFVHDRETGTTRRVSVGSDGIQANNEIYSLSSSSPAISADGSSVVFQSSAKNLVVNDTNNSRDIFVYNYAQNAINGTASDDTLTGTFAYDRITGFGGADILTGGAGSDEFVYTDIQDAGDTITDFGAGGDRIVLTQLFQSLGLSSLVYATAIVQGYLSFSTQGKDTTVLLDPDSFAGGDRPTPLLTVLNVSAETLNNPLNFVI